MFGDFNRCFPSALHSVTQGTPFSHLSVFQCFALEALRCQHWRHTQWLRALAANTEDLGSVVSTHVVVYSHNSSSRGSNALFWPPQARRQNADNKYNEYLHKENRSEMP